MGLATTVRCCWLLPRGYSCSDASLSFYLRSRCCLDMYGGDVLIILGLWAWAAA